MCAALLSTVQNNWIVKIIPTEKFLNIEHKSSFDVGVHDCCCGLFVTSALLQCQAAFVWHEQSAPKCVSCHIVLLAYCSWILYLMLSFMLVASFVLRMEWMNEWVNCVDTYYFVIVSQCYCKCVWIVWSVLVQCLLGTMYGTLCFLKLFAGDRSYCGRFSVWWIQGPLWKHTGDRVCAPLWLSCGCCG